MDVQITIFLDTRRKKKNGKYPVKLRVWGATVQKQKLYPTGLDLTKDEFKKAWLNPKPKGKNYANFIYLNKQLEKADETANKLKPFTFERFESKLFTKKGDGKDVFYQYAEKISELKHNGQVGTMETYDLALKSLRDYLTNCKRKKTQSLSFYTITPDWLQGFENYMVNTKGRSPTTVSIYLRTLRTLFNKAIKANYIEQSVYPFGDTKDGKYQIPSGTRQKKALTEAQFKTLKNAEAQTPEQRKALDFWLFSFYCNGMNIKDIALLKYKQIEGDWMTFYRAKTIRTAKSDRKEIIVNLTDFPKQVIDQYGHPDHRPNDYVFGIIEPDDDPDTTKRKVKKFTRYINQHVKKIAADNDLPTDISTYWARHSRATIALNLGASTEQIKDELGHSDVRVTENYLAGFNRNNKKQLAAKIANL